MSFLLQSANWIQEQFHQAEIDEIEKLFNDNNQIRKIFARLNSNFPKLFTFSNFFKFKIREAFFP